MNEQRNPANQLAADPANRVHAIVMPLVRAMRDGNLSWSDKEEIAGVIREVMREAQAMRQAQAKQADAARNMGLAASSGFLGIGGKL